MSNALPCPFCSGTSIEVSEGSTFRWVKAFCASCGAQAGEVRRDTLIPSDKSWPQAREDAIKQWNTRVKA